MMSALPSPHRVWLGRRRPAFPHQICTNICVTAVGTAKIADSENADWERDSGENQDSEHTEQTPPRMNSLNRVADHDITYFSRELNG